MSSRSSSRLLLLVTVLLVAANLRSVITVVGPLVERIGVDTGFNPLALGALGSIPIFVFGFVSPFVHLMGTRLGLDRTIFAALLVLTGGTLLRSYGEALMPTWISLYAGTALLAAAIGVGNVLVPAVVKRDFPDKVAVMTGLYTSVMIALAALASGVAVPVADTLGWENTLAAPAALTLLAIAAWLMRRSRRSDRHQHTSVPLPGGHSVPNSVWSQPLAWQVTAFFGLQSTVFFIMLTWFPAIQTSHGIPEASAGMWLGIFQAVGVVANLLIGPVLQRMPDQRLFSAVITAFMLTAILGIMFAPSLMPVWAVCLGLSTGTSLLLALTLVSVRAGSIEKVGKLSGMAQGVGYLLAACGPLAAGALYQAADSWTPVLWCVVGIVLLLGTSGHLASRNRQLR
ncbi:CynX/NimT family MFS transporter [Nesterenkonia sp. MY13]|uniref:CynX/NimT family MFS transporter n=1 Tax=Nesterenkonia sedimenti TaxID=1463632 RepID=A0A7X8YDI3_9MICC|nr:MFS transporter [Nesterenkonia sedimenti]NLS09401.1 CynX/NimT family MFS transporter [Nesterenkonia sedimenti]